MPIQVRLATSLLALGLCLASAPAFAGQAELPEQPQASASDELPTQLASAEGVDASAELSAPEARVSVGMLDYGNDGRLYEPGLRVVRRAHTAKVTSLKVGLALLGAFSGGQHVRAFSKEQLKGDRLEALPDPTQRLAEPLQVRLETLLATYAGDIAPARVEVKLRPRDWTLIYQELGRSDTPYALRYGVSIHIQQKQASGEAGSVRPLRSLTCEPEHSLLPLEQWEAQEYAQVHQASTAFIEQCVELAAAEFASWLAPEPIAEAPGDVASSSMPAADAQAPEMPESIDARGGEDSPPVVAE